MGARSLDVLHVAAAVTTQSEQFGSLDQRQKVLARKAGLKVVRI